MEIAGGVWPFEFDWDAATNFQTDSIAINLANGLYQLTITDAINCTTVATVFVDTINVMTSAIADFSNPGSIEVFPNPSSGALTVQVSLQEPAQIDMSIQSLLGQSLISKNSATPVDQADFYFDLSLYPSGIYIIRFMIDGAFVDARRIVLSR